MERSVRKMSNQSASLQDDIAKADSFNPNISDLEAKSKQAWF